MIADKLDYLLDIIEVLIEYEELDARVHDALREASNLIYRVTHDDELNHDNA